MEMLANAMALSIMVLSIIILLLAYRPMNRYFAEREQIDDSLHKARSEFEMRVNERAKELTRTIESLNIEVDERKWLEDALRESEAKLRGLYELSPLGIALTDMKGHFVEFNESFRRICGYSTEELKS